MENMATMSALLQHLQCLRYGLLCLLGFFDGHGILFLLLDYGAWLGMAMVLAPCPGGIRDGKTVL
jgi:hypothetical protein